MGPQPRARPARLVRLGYYNMFLMTQEVYGAWQKPQGCPLQDWTDVAKPQVYTPLGVQQPAAGRGPRSRGRPTKGSWAGRPGHDAGEALTTLVNFIAIALKNIIPHWIDLWSQPSRGRRPFPRPPPLSLAGAFLQVATASPSLHRDESVQAGALYAHRASACCRSNRSWTRAGAVDQGARTASRGARSGARGRAAGPLCGDRGIARGASAGVPAALAASPTPDGCKWQVVRELVDLSGAMLRATGIDLIVLTSLESLDSLDFRAWLLENGATPAIVQG